MDKLLTDFEGKLNKTVEHFRHEMATVKAGRANPAILNKITVDYYGTPTPLNQMANITVPDARTLLINLWDAGALKDVVKAINASDLGINPVDDGKSIRLGFPQLNEERRKELAKGARKTCEDSKVALRNERRDVMELFKKQKKDNLITEDDLTGLEKEAQKLVDKASEQLEKVLKEKEKEILEV